MQARQKTQADIALRRAEEKYRRKISDHQYYLDNKEQLNERRRIAYYEKQECKQMEKHYELLQQLEKDLLLTGKYATKKHPSGSVEEPIKTTAQPETALDSVSPVKRVKTTILIENNEPTTALKIFRENRHCQTEAHTISTSSFSLLNNSNNEDSTIGNQNVVEKINHHRSWE